MRISDTSTGLGHSGFQPSVLSSKKFKQLISFIYKSNDNRIRGILTKEKNEYFIELFLDKHKYYDRKRKYLGL